MRVGKSTLKKLLTIAKSGKTNCILLSNGKFYIYTIKNTVVVYDSKQYESFTTAIELDTLKAITLSCNEFISISEAGIAIDSDNVVIKLNYCNDEIPNITTFEYSGNYELNQDYINALDISRIVVSKNCKEKVHLNSLYHDNVDNQLHIVATNGYVLNNIPTGPCIEALQGKTISLDLVKYVKLLKGSITLNVVDSTNYFMLSDGNFSIYSLFTTVNYPNYKRFIPVIYNRCEIDFKEFYKVFKAIKPFATKTENNSIPIVYIDFNSGKSTIKVSGNDVSFDFNTTANKFTSIDTRFSLRYLESLINSLKILNIDKFEVCIEAARNTTVINTEKGLLMIMRINN